MEAYYCDKCKKYFNGDRCPLPDAVTPFKLKNRDTATHLCLHCTFDLQDVIDKWFGFPVKDRKLSGGDGGDGDYDSDEKSTTGFSISMHGSDAQAMADLSGVHIKD